MSKKLVNILLYIAIGIFVFGVGYQAGVYNTSKGKVDRSSYSILNTQKPSGSSVKNVDFSLFWDTWAKVEQKFVDQKKLDPQKMYYGAIKGMVASLDDPYTFFLTPDENKKSKDELGGKFEGIGAQLGLKDNMIVIVAPIKNSPAERAGIRAGDYIIKVDGKSTKGWTLTEAVSKIRGDKGTKVILTVNRGDKELEFPIVRDQIHVDSVETEFISSAKCTSNCPQIAYVKINQFGENTNDEWDAAVSQVAQKWNAKQVKGMVLDLRDNPGGYLDSSVYLASEFLPMNAVVVKQESTSSPDDNKEYRVFRQGLLQNIPLVVLINKGSASASEILSGALRDHKRARLVGEKSFGKGSVQEVLDLQEGAGLHVTVAKWILPNGDWINGKGIEPETKVENKIDEANTMTKATDAQLETAIQQVLQ